jgi:hypothetical protein
LWGALLYGWSLSCEFGDCQTAGGATCWLPKSQALLGGQAQFNAENHVHFFERHHKKELGGVLCSMAAI